MSNLDGITKMSYAETDIPTRTLALNANPDDNGDSGTDDALMWILIGILPIILTFTNYFRALPFGFKLFPSVLTKTQQTQSPTGSKSLTQMSLRLYPSELYSLPGCIIFPFLQIMLAL